MSGLSPKYPLLYDHKDGFYLLNKTYEEVISQNLKNLVLTAPGERIMDINFGVGIYKLLFEQESSEMREELSTRIISQVAKYMPFVNILEVKIFPNEEERQHYMGEISNYINIYIIYAIPSLDLEDTLEINIVDI